MILIGQYDSPYVRRVGLALVHYGIDFTHSPLSAFGDAAALARLNPLMRVPALVLPDDQVLTDSAVILDWLDEQAPQALRLVPAAGPVRRAILQVTALATGTADKAVTLFYLRRMVGDAGATWAERLIRQIGGGLGALEAQLDGRAAFFDTPNHADIAVACLWRFLADAMPDVTGDRPGLSALSDAAEATAAFRQISQPFIPPT